MSDIQITFAIIVAIVVLFIWNRLPVEVVAIGATLTLWATGVLSLDQAIAGFGDPTVLFIASLFVVSEGLDATGATTWVGQRLIEAAGEGRARLIVLMMLIVALLTALISVNGAVAALLPVVVVMAVRLGRPTSQLMIPLVFGAHAGSLLAFTGTPVHVLIVEASKDAGAGGFGFLEFALVGIPLVAGTIAIVVLLGERLLPARTPGTLPPDLSSHARTLVEEYRLADADGAAELADALVDRSVGVAEVVIPPRSPLVGRQVFPGMVTEQGDLVVLAVTRAGETRGPGTVTLATGDTLLVKGSWDALDSQLARPHVLVVDAPDVIRRQTVPMGRGAREAIIILVGMVVLLATGAVPSVVAGLLAALAMIVSRVLTMQGAYRGINWTTVVLVGAMIPLSTAMVQSGAADAIAEQLIALVGDAGPTVLLAGLFLITAAFGQLISNMATALIVIPIALAAAAGLGVSVQPVLMSLTVAAAAALLTPVATPVNLMVMAPGGYRFGDYWKIGLPVMALFFIVAVFLVPFFWPF